jgi:hypothetical protein
MRSTSTAAARCTTALTQTALQPSRSLPALAAISTFSMSKVQRCQSLLRHHSLQLLRRGAAQDGTCCRMERLCTRCAEAPVSVKPAAAFKSPTASAFAVGCSHRPPAPLSTPRRAPGKSNLLLPCARREACLQRSQQPLVASNPLPSLSQLLPQLPVQPSPSSGSSRAFQLRNDSGVLVPATAPQPNHPLQFPANFTLAV